MLHSALSLIIFRLLLFFVFATACIVIGYFSLLLRYLILHYVLSLIIFRHYCAAACLLDYARAENPCHVNQQFGRFATTSLLIMGL
jgi:hypothetical protein